MSDSSDDEEVLPKRMCAARARSQLGATEKILRTLACQLVTNPHYRSAAPMRMYDTQEVQEAVQQEAANRQYLKDHKDKIEAEKTASQKEAAKKKAASAAQACAQFSEIPTSREGLSRGSHHSTKLPLDVWSSILEKLCPPSLSALEGPSTVARYIINAQLACHECHAASAAAWGALAALIQADQMQPCVQCSEEEYSICKQVKTGSACMSTGSCRMLWEVHVANPVRHLSNTLRAEVPWDQVVASPLSLKHSVLKEACRSVGEQVSGTKAVLVLRLLQYFKIDRPCAVPALVLLAVKHEKVLYRSTQWNQSIDLMLAVYEAFKHFTQTEVDHDRTTMFAVRKVLASNFASLTHLLQWKDAKSVAASMYVPQKLGKSRTRQEARRTNNTAGSCACGNEAALACQQACCKKCCQGPCARHRC